MINVNANDKIVVKGETKVISAEYAVLTDTILGASPEVVYTALNYLFAEKRDSFNELERMMEHIKTNYKPRHAKFEKDDLS